MKKVIKNINVDAGLIWISDVAHFPKYDCKYKDGYEIFDLKKGIITELKENWVHIKTENNKEYDKYSKEIVKYE